MMEIASVFTSVALILLVILALRNVERSYKPIEPEGRLLKRDSNGEVLAEVFYYPEFAMGAQPVVIIPARPVGDTDVFYTTNGVVAAGLGAGNRYYYIHDACTVLRVCRETNCVTHWRRPRPYYISNFQELPEGFHVGLYGGKPYSKWEEFPTIPWQEGFGDVRSGRFTSANDRLVPFLTFPKRNE